MSRVAEIFMWSCFVEVLNSIYMAKYYCLTALPSLYIHPSASIQPPILSVAFSPSIFMPSKPTNTHTSSVCILISTPPDRFLYSHPMHIPPPMRGLSRNPIKGPATQRVGTKRASNYYSAPYVCSLVSSYR